MQSWCTHDLVVSSKPGVSAITNFLPQNMNCLTVISVVSDLKVCPIPPLEPVRRLIIFRRETLLSQLESNANMYTYCSFPSTCGTHDAFSLIVSRLLNQPCLSAHAIIISPSESDCTLSVE